VSNRNLARHSASHDVGLALEIPHCSSRDLTATNKIFEYLRCGLAVIASDTCGQQEVMDGCPKAGWMVPADDSEKLAEIMQKCLHDRPALAQARKESRKAGRDIWAWENFSSQLGEALKGAAGLPADAGSDF
jgi:glycosyltransferase involved in cell wall biosynthesis